MQLLTNAVSIVTYCTHTPVCVSLLSLSHTEQSGGQTPSVEQLELRLVQSRHDIENPPDIHGLTSNGRCHVMKMS